MIAQDVVSTSPVTRGECGLLAFKAEFVSQTPRPPTAPNAVEKDLVFFMTRSYKTLTFCDGGD